MTQYEREIVKRIYPIACTGDKKAIKILQNLTTNRRKGIKCLMCNNRTRIKKKNRKAHKFCSILCKASFSRRAKINNHQ